MSKAIDSATKEELQAKLAKAEEGKDPLTRDEIRSLLESANLNVKDSDVNLCYELLTNVWKKSTMFDDLMLFIDQLVSADKAALIKELFDSLDSNHDGVLSEEEVRNGFKSLGIELSSEEVNGLFVAADENASNVLEFEEFAKVVGPHL